MSTDAVLASEHHARERDDGRAGRALLIAGVAVAALAAAAYAAALAAGPARLLLKGFDLAVYLGGAGQALHHPAHLYAWTYQGHPGIKFTYTPFAALAFAAGRVLPFRALLGLVAAVSVACLLATIWIAFRELGWKSLTRRTGATLLLGGIALWSEPVQRGLNLGQVELGLMALVVWDLCQDDKRWWKGAATGLAAGIKFIPGLFILYLLITKRFRQAFVAIGAFAASVGIGFAALPGPSGPFWLRGDFFAASRTGFVGSLQNQSLRGAATRLAGSVDGGMLPWLAAAVIVIGLGLWAASRLHNAGYAFAGLMVTGLVAQLASPISWDHHWVWYVPGVAVLADAAVRAGRGRARAAWYTLAGVVVAAFAAWPDFWQPSFSLFQGGLINYAPMASFESGDNPAYPEYHWHGLQLVAGNLYVLTGLGLLAVALAAAVTVTRRRRAAAASG